MSFASKENLIFSARGTDRYGWVDIAKGICIIAVVCLYARRYVALSLGDAGWLTPWAAFARPFRMPDFFLLSGLFLGVVIDRPWRSYLDSKVLHYIYFLVLWVTLLYGFEWMFNSNFSGRNDSILRALRRYFYLIYHPDHMLWFIQILPIYFLMTRILKALSGYLIIGLSALAILVAPNTGISVFDNSCSYYFYFVIGYLGARHIFNYADFVGRHRCIASVLLVSWVIINSWAVNTGLTSAVAGGVVFGILGISAVIALSRLLADFRQFRLIQYIGEKSIVVYLGFFIPLQITVQAYSATSQPLNIHVAATVVVVLSVGVPILFFIGTQKTWLRVLFVRPAWARLDRLRHAPEEA